MLHQVAVVSLVIVASLAARTPACAQQPASGAERFARWEKAIAAFEDQDRKQPPPQNAYLFVGSSSIRLWDLPRSFPDWPVLNRGFGGSQIADSVHFAPRLILKHKPRMVLLYAGDNDIAAKRTPEQVLADFQALAAAVHKELPTTVVAFLSIKPSLARWKLWDQIRGANALVKAFCRSDRRLLYIDVGTAMLGADGTPRPELFVKDGLHLSAAGYALWAALVQADLRDEQQDPRAFALRKATLLHASFDETVQADHGDGARTLATRFNHATEKGQFVVEKGFDEKVFRIARGKGVRGGALEVTDVLPRNGRVFFPAKGNLAYRPKGWSGAVSLWLNTDPNTLLKTRFCDPVQITHKGAHDGGLWCDFNDAKPRDLRMGVFPALAAGAKPIKEDAPEAPLVRVPGIGFKQGEWHHVVLTWQDLDAGSRPAQAALFLDGKLLGQVRDRPLAMSWDIEKTGIYLAVNYIGLLDEFAVFGRALSAEEVALLYQKPDLLRQAGKH